jgi:tetratricopeptide (TPR) repeat protein
LARPTRHELKEDKFKTTFEEYEQFAKEHYREIFVAVGLSLGIIALVVGLRVWLDRQEALANAQLGEALDTFHAYVGTPAPGTPGQAFPTVMEKYSKALAEFSVMANVTGFPKLLPEPKAVRIARYHVGLCQAALGDEAGAIKTFTEAAKDRDPDIASLAKYSEAQELAKTDKLSDAVKIYQGLCDHPSSTVPKAIAELALGDAYRATQPAQARQVYERMAKEFAGEPEIGDAVRQQIASLPKN